MTEKKELIIQTALRLFSEQGYDATPTSQIAKAAGVSEGLIFRHFTNKEGLMDALLIIGQERISPHVNEILKLKSSKKVIEKVIGLPLLLIQKEQDFWSLQFMLKWQKKKLSNYQSASYMPLLLEKTVTAMKDLGLKNAKNETTLLFITLEGVGSALLTQSIDFATAEQTLNLLKSKYI